MSESRVELLRGTLDMLVLKTLTLGPMHGYQIARHIQRTTDDVLKVEEGSLYPALYRMERRGWIEFEWGTSENNRKAKFYRPTRKGLRRLEQERAAWTTFSRAADRILAVDA